MNNEPHGDDRRVLTGRLFRVRSGQKVALTAEEPMSEPAEPVRRPARVAQMLALAHALENAIEEGFYENRAEVASVLGLTRARITQFLGLTMLAPDIQEELLFLEAIDGVEPLSVRALRPIARMASWREQRDAWRCLRGSIA